MPILDNPNFYIHRAVYWAPNGINNNGQVIFSSPAELCCRWNDHIETFMDRNGNQEISRAKVRLPYVLEELGVLWQGCLVDLTSPTTNPFANRNAWEIRQFRIVSSRHGGTVLRYAIL